MVTSTSFVEDCCHLPTLWAVYAKRFRPCWMEFVLVVGGKLLEAVHSFVDSG